MPRDNNRAEFELWFEQAQFDLKSAEDSLQSGNYEWSCFQAQQAAEKALKAYLYLQGEREIYTHSVFQLIALCAKYDKRFEELRPIKELDNYYVPTRYPNALPRVVPHKFYGKEDAAKCVGYAREVISQIGSFAKK
jgi:HEPN domain-containing protein